MQILYDICSACPDGTGTYDLPATCTNCGSRYIWRRTKGHTPNSARDCPHCGVSYRWRFGTSAEAAALLSEREVST